jgi:hypothetical protein
MAAYTFYAIGLYGQIGVTTVECDNDASAIDEARKLTDCYYVQVWQGPRVVSHLMPGSLDAEKLA